MITIIHPEDTTTTFLNPIYASIPQENKVTFNKNATYDDIRDMLIRSDRVFMMGHGSSNGLFGSGIFDTNKDFLDISMIIENFWALSYERIKTICPLVKTFVISHEEVEFLKDKPNNVYIWCHADEFVENNNLQGFYSGMFISEMRECHYANLTDLDITSETIDESNNTFALIVGKYINFTVDLLYERVMKEYGELAKTNPVAKYNYERLYIR